MTNTIADTNARRYLTKWAYKNLWFTEVNSINFLLLITNLIEVLMFKRQIRLKTFNFNELNNKETYDKTTDSSLNKKENNI